MTAYKFSFKERSWYHSDEYLLSNCGKYGVDKNGYGTHVGMNQDIIKTEYTLRGRNITEGTTYSFDDELLTVVDGNIKYHSFEYPAKQLVKMLNLNEKIKLTGNLIGLELEFLSNSNTDDLRDHFEDRKKAFPHVDITDDGSVEGECPHCGNTVDGSEARLLTSEDTFQTDIKKLLDELKKFNAYTNKTCGLHVHLDMRNRDVEAAYKKLLDKIDDLYDKCDPSRKSNTYCNRNSKRLKRTESGHYHGINGGDAYDDHQTIEIRMHEGTLDYEEIVSWIEFLIGIVNG